jgi:hypothetical protein
MTGNISSEKTTDSFPDRLNLAIHGGHDGHRKNMPNTTDPFYLFGIRRAAAFMLFYMANNRPCLFPKSNKYWHLPKYEGANVLLVCPNIGCESFGSFL